MKNNLLKASIIILTYKKFDNISSNIRSILKQTYNNYEVIISDDGSSNIDINTIEKIYNNDEKASAFRIITREKNVGTVRNYNEAIKASSGDIIVPLSQDDEFVDEYALSRIMETFSDQKINVCLGLRKNSETSHVIPNNLLSAFMRKATNKKLWLRNACSNLYWGAALYYRKEYLMSLGLFDESYVLVEDYSTVMRILRTDEKIFIMDKPTIYYGMDGITKSKNGKKSFNPVYLKDSIHICEDNYKNSKLLLNSKICHRYLKYNVKWWRQYEDENRINKYSDLVVDFIIIASKIMSIFTKKGIDDCRFTILWFFEKQATNLHSLKEKNAEY